MPCCRDAPSEFTRVVADVLPDPSDPRYYWFFFTPTRARYVQLRAVDTYGHSILIIYSFTVFTPHEGGLTVPLTDRSIGGGEPIIAWRWDFGDGAISHEQHPTHTYSAPGTYVVTLTVIDAYGLTSTANHVYNAYGPPIADFVTTPDPAAQADWLRLQDRSSAVSAPLVEVALIGTGAPIADALDGWRYPLRPGSFATIWMVRSGTVRAMWEATDANLLRDVVVRDIPIANILPTIDVGADQTRVWGQPWVPVDPVTLTDATIEEWGYLACTYDFADGPPEAGSSPCVASNFYLEHAWSAPGTYMVTATATDLSGGSSDDVFVVEVTRRDAAIALSPVPGAAAGGRRSVSAQLMDLYDATAPMAGRTIVFELGTQTASALTDATGRATVSLDFAPSMSQTVIADFAGDELYVAASGAASYPETLRPSYPGNCGTDYWIALPNPCRDNGECPRGERGSEPFYRHHLFFSAEASTAVRVDMPGLGRTAWAYVDSTGVGQLALPIDQVAAVRRTGEVVNDTLHIQSERIVCVHGLEFIRTGAEGFLALPTNSLGREYVVGAYEGLLTGDFGQTWVSQFVVVGTEDGTDVTIDPAYDVVRGPDVAGGFGSAHVPFTVRLNQGEVIQIRAYSSSTPGPGDTYYDLTGSTISASAPVAVLGGHMCPYVPPGTQACNTLVEQLPSVETLGTEYLVTPFAVRGSGYLVRVVAATSGTEVRVDGALVATLARGTFYELDEATQAAHVVTTSQPALVTQYAKGLAAESDPLAIEGDPVMLVVVPAEQFDNGARVSTVPDHEWTRFDGRRATRETWSYDSYLNIVVPTADAGGVRVDGAPVAAPFTPIGSSSWAYAQVPVTEGAHSVTHLSPSVPVGVTVYGWAPFDGYAYPARMRLTPLAGGCTPSATVPGDGLDNDCDGRFDEELGDGLDDDGDGLTDEDLVFESGPPVNLPPFAYDRADSLTEDSTKTLVLIGSDPNGDPLTYEVLTLPAFGALAGSGTTYDYTPSPDYNGPDSFTYRVCDASLCSPSATFALTIRPANDLPLITMGALYTALEDELFELGLLATDPEGGALAWRVVSAPAGLAVDSELARLYWTPDSRFGDTTLPVTLAVTDPAGGRAEVSFGIRVLDRPDAPTITSRPIERARYASTYVYDVEATDPDPFEVFTFFLSVGPASMAIDPLSGVITWAPAITDVGTHPVEVFVRDRTGLLSEPQRFDLVVTGDVTPPEVQIELTDPVLPLDLVPVHVTASDDDMALIEGLTIGGVPVPLDASGDGTWTAPAPGRFTAEASAIDPSGNRGLATREIRVLDASDTEAPFVELTAPVANDVLTYLHDATGTVRDPNLHRWYLEMRPAHRGAYRTMLSGTNAVESALLGQLDVTQLRNGTYFLRLRADDLNGATSQTVEIPVRVEGGAKLGVVHLEFTDLVVPDFGIPIAVNRIYDSRDAETVGDFGYGWNLDIRQGTIHHNYPVGRGIAVFTNTGDFTPCSRFTDQLGHYAEVRLSDDEWYIFRPIIPDQATITGGCGGHVAYELVDGIRPGAELRIAGNSAVRATALPVIGISGFAPDSNLLSIEDESLFDPQDFELLLPDGRRFGLNATRGITWIEDQNGNSLSIAEPGPFGSPGGLIHSSGRNVIFIRDAEGRIIQVMDGAGRSTGYEYDAIGNLAAFIDLNGRRTTFEYNAAGHPHHLTDIIDWRGVRVAAIDYQADGRMRRMCDADRVCVQNQYDLAAQTLLRFTGLPAPVLYAYDQRGNVTRQRDGLGNETRFRYGVPPLDVLLERTDADGAVTTFQYALQSRDLIAQIDPHLPTEDPDDFTTRYTYRDWSDGTRWRRALSSMTQQAGGTVFYDTDDDGNQVRVRDDAGNVIFDRSFNPDGTIATFTDRFGTVAYTYGPEARPTRVVGADGTVTDLEYEVGGQVSVLRRGGITQRFRYDAGGRRIHSDFGNGATVTYEYGDTDDWTAIRGPTFGRVERRMSARGRLLSATQPNGDTTSQSYDAAGQLRAEIDELGNVTEHLYDAAGRLERTVDHGRGATTSYTRDAVGRVLTTTDPEGEVRSFTYDVRGNVATTTDERMNVSTSATLPASSSRTDPLGNTTTSALSPHGLPAGTTYPGGASISSEYLGVTNLDASTSFPLAQHDESARTRAFGYDARSILQSATDLGGNAWSYQHAEVLGGDVRWDVGSGAVSLGVDGAGAPVSRYSSRDDSRDAPRPEETDAWTDRLSRVTSPLGEVTSWTFGAGGEIARVDYPFGGSLTRTLGGDLRVATETRPFGTTLTFARDAAGRVTGRAGDDGSAQSFTYGPRDRLDTISDAMGTTAYRYDTAGRFAGLDYPSRLGFEQDHDVRDYVSAVRVHGDPAADPRVFESTYTYDPAGNLETVTDPFGRTTTYSYDAANRLDTITRPNGVTTTHTYDPRGWTTSIVHADAGATVIASVAYVRSPSGEPTRITREDGSYVLVDYDPALRVERERYFDAADVLDEELAYTYDADGNRTSRTRTVPPAAPIVETYHYAPGSELTSIDVAGTITQAFTYDAGGRVTRIQRDGRDLELSYDADDHTVAIEDLATAERDEYDFDARGRRTQRRRLVSGVLAAALTMTVAPGLASGLDSPHLTADAAGAPQHGQVFDGEHAMARYDASSTEPVYYLRDAMGSVIGLVDGAGASSARIHYDGFGNERRSDGALAALPSEGAPRFQGMWLESSGLYYARARSYDSRTSFFLSRDQQPGRRAMGVSWHPYAFVANSPYIARDPTGRDTLSESLTLTAGLNILANAALSTLRVAALTCIAFLLKGEVEVEVGVDPRLTTLPCEILSDPAFQVDTPVDAAQARALYEIGFIEIPVVITPLGRFSIENANEIFSDLVFIPPTGYLADAYFDIVRGEPELGDVLIGVHQTRLPRGRTIPAIRPPGGGFR